MIKVFTFPELFEPEDSPPPGRCRKTAKPADHVSQIEGFESLLRLLRKNPDLRTKLISALREKESETAGTTEVTFPR
jgi:hypothetical protein